MLSRDMASPTEILICKVTKQDDHSKSYYSVTIFFDGEPYNAENKYKSFNDAWNFINNLNIKDFTLKAFYGEFEDYDAFIYYVYEDSDEHYHIEINIDDNTYRNNKWYNREDVIRNMFTVAFSTGLPIHIKSDKYQTLPHE